MTDVRGASPAEPIRQRAVLVLPSTGEFDSRTYRIATTLLARGHEVTVIARWTAGLATDEVVPAGYRIIRIRVAAVDGLPLPGLFRGVRAVIRGGRRLVGRARAPRPTPAATASAATGSATRAERGSTAPSLAGAPPAAPLRPPSVLRRAYGSLIRRLAIPLTIRSHVKAARDLAPAADLYHGMAYMGIPVALDLGRRHRARVVYDARDIYLEARNMARMNRPARWLLGWAERRWAHQAARVITVNDAYADVMAERFGVARPLVVMNCAYRFDPPRPADRRFHAALDLPAGERVVLYHGGLFPQRGIEELMSAIRAVPEATLVLMGYGVLEPELRAAAAEPSRANRVRLLPAVRPDELLDWVAAADVVAMPIQASTLNHRLTTPNKLFEAMAAGVAVVASDLPGMATIVRATRCGLVCDPADPAAIASAIRDVLDGAPEDRAGWGERALAAAHETYNWERQAAILLDEYSRLTGRPW